MAHLHFVFRVGFWEKNLRMKLCLRYRLGGEKFTVAIKSCLKRDGKQYFERRILGNILVEIFLLYTIVDSSQIMS